MRTRLNAGARHGAGPVGSGFLLISTPLIATAVLSIVAATGASLYAQLIDNGVQINTDSAGMNIPDDAANEPSFVVSPVDPDAIVAGWRQFDTITSDVRFAGFAYSWDGGKTWTNGGILDRPPGSGAGANQSDPVLAVDAEGVFFYNSLIFRSQHDGLTTYRSATGGMTWETPVYLMEGFQDKNWYTTDRTGGIGFRNHYAIVRGVLFNRSTDNGQTWSALMDIGNGTMSYVSVGPDGELLAAWRDGSVVRVRRSDNARDPNQSPTFDTARTLDFGRTPRNLRVNPGGAAGQVYVELDHSDSVRRGWVYVLASSTQANDGADVIFARSMDGGQTFGDLIRVNDDDDPNGNDLQWMAAMSVAPGGRVDAVWFDTRDDPNHFLSRLYYSYSYDAGSTWAPNRPLTDLFDSTLGFPVQQKIGDYFQSQSDNGGVSIVYPATFNGEEDLYFRRTHPIVLEMGPLQAGREVQINAAGAIPKTRIWLALSVTGQGRTHIPILDVDLELDQPVQVGQAVMTDASGNARVRLFVPDGTSGRDVWLQAAQFNNASNVVASTVQQ